jgi:glycosyltransferase involved in cell wall biosynthesis
MPELMAAKHGYGPAVGILRVLQQWACREADDVLVTTEPMRDLVGELHGVAAVQVPNVVDPTTFVRRVPDLRPLQQRPLRVVYHGTVADRFGVDVAVDAVARLRAEGVPVELDVYGDGNAMQQVKQRADSAGTGVVRLHGQVPAASLPGLLEGAALGLVPYKDSSFMRLVESTKAYEYASLGIPVVGSDLPPLRAQLGDRGALYFTPGDAESLARAIKTAAENPEETLEIARRAQREVETCEWSHWQDRYMEAVTRRWTA